MRVVILMALFHMVTFVAMAEPGDITWADSYGINPGSLSATAVTLEGAYISAGGMNNSSSENDIWVMKADVDGAEIWSVCYGNGNLEDEVEAIIATSDGGYLICGQTSTYATDIDDAFLWKLDAHGAIVWQELYVGPGYTNFKSMITNSDGNIVCAGYSESTSMLYQGVVAVYSPEGDLLDSAVIGGQYNDLFSHIEQLPDGSYIACGFSQPGGGTEEFSLVKLSSELSVEWMRNYDGTVRARANSIALTNTGGFVICGFVGNYGNALAWLLRLDENGDEIWQQTYGGNFWDSGNCVIALSNGDFAVAGFSSIISGTWHPWVFNINSEGELIWETVYDVSGGTSIELIEDAEQNLIVCGQIRVSNVGHGLLMKLENSYDTSAVPDVDNQIAEALPTISILPNPCQSATMVSFDLPEARNIKAEVYDVDGRLVRTLIDSYENAGRINIQWNGKDNRNESVSPGIYFVRMQNMAPGEGGKVILIR